MDYVYRRANTNDMHVLVSTPTGFQDGSDVIRWGTKLHGSAPSPAESAVTDLNGDGMADFIYRASGSYSFYALISNGNGFNAEVLWGTRDYGPATSPYEGGFYDLNGDGKTDFIYRRANTVEMRALISTENRFEDEDFLWGTKDSPFYPADVHQGCFGDMNGDGYTDYVYVNGSEKLRAMISDGTCFIDDIQVGEKRWETGPQTIIYALVDINGDGMDDYVYRRLGYMDLVVKLAESDADDGIRFGADYIWDTAEYPLHGAVRRKFQRCDWRWKD